MTAEELKIILEGLSDEELKSKVYTVNKCTFSTLKDVKLERSLSTNSTILIIEINEC